MQYHKPKYRSTQALLFEMEIVELRVGVSETQEDSYVTCAAPHSSLHILTLLFEFCQFCFEITCFVL